MKRLRRQVRRDVGRAATVAAALVVLAGGTAFAVLQSQQVTLTQNSIHTAAASLQLSRDGTTYADSQLGFDFADLVPGGQPMPVTGNKFYLKNTGTAPLSLHLSATEPDNPDAANLSQVKIILTTIGANLKQEFDLQSLIDAAPTGGAEINMPLPLVAGVAQQYSLQASMSQDAINGSSATLGGIDLIFTGIVPVVQ